MYLHIQAIDSKKKNSQFNAMVSKKTQLNDDVMNAISKDVAHLKFATNQIIQLIQETR